MSHSTKVSLSSFLVFPRQVVTWSESRHDNRNRFGVLQTDQERSSNTYHE